MGTHISHSPAETEALGQEWGQSAASGLILGLVGDLGAGKTQIVKGLARGLNVNARVHSPTFALVNVYSGGRLTLFHLDLYRLEGPKEIATAGLDDYLEPKGVTVIEWADKWLARPSPERPPPQDVGTAGPGLKRTSMNDRLRWVEIEILSDTQRRIHWEDFSR